MKHLSNFFGLVLILSLLVGCRYQAGGLHQTTPSMEVVSTSDCVAYVWHTGSGVAGRSLVTTWRVGHSAGHDRPKNVHFEYRIRFIDTRGHPSVVHRRFLEWMRGSGGQFTRQDSPTPSTITPAEIVSVDFHNARCY